MSTMLEIKELIDAQGEAWKKSLTRLDAMEAVLEEMHVAHNRQLLSPFAGGASIKDGPESKALAAACRALIKGDQAKFMEQFVEAKAMSVGSDPDGGYMVHPVISSGFTAVMAEISPLYRLARKVPMPHGDAFEEPVDNDSAEANWAGEAESRDDTDTPQLGLLRIELHEVTAMPKVTQKLIDTASFDPVAWLTRKVGDAFGVKEGTAFHSGTGVGQPRGLLTYTTAATPDSSRTWGQFEHIATGANGAFPTSSASVNPADVLVDVVAALKAQYRANARWLMNKLTAARVRKLKDAEGRHVWVDSLVQGQPPMLLGFPVEIDESMPDVGTGTLSIAFGDFHQGYTVVEKPGAKFLTDPYTAKPYVRLYAYRRVGGAACNYEAIKFLKFS